MNNIVFVIRIVSTNNVTNVTDEYTLIRINDKITHLIKNKDRNTLSVIRVETLEYLSKMINNKDLEITITHMNHYNTDINDINTIR